MISRGRTAPAPSVVVVAVAVATAATLGLMIVVDAQTIRPGCLPADPGSHDLWCPGDNNYTCYKIPSLLRIPPSAANDSDVLLAFIEGRKYSCADDGGHVDILLRRSLNGGATWGAASMVYGNSTDGPRGQRDWHTIGDALPLWDPVSQLVHLVFTRDNRDAFYTRSADAGVHWQHPTNITSMLFGGDREAFCGTGHAAGLVLSGPGELLVPMYGGSVGNPFVASSLDQGATWSVKGVVPAPPNEWTFAPIPTSTWSGAGARGGGGAGDGAGDGSRQGLKLLGTVRGDGGKRLQSVSLDGGATWGPAGNVANIPEPISGCEGALVAHPNGNMYFSHPDSDVLRERMLIWVSIDGGQRWQDHTEIWGPHSPGCRPETGCVPATSYSSMAVLGDDPDSEIGLIFMRNNKTLLVFEGSPSYTTFEP